MIVTAGEDDDADDEQTRVTHRVSGYGDVTTADAVTVTAIDDDTPGVVVAPTTLTIDEGGSATYTVALATRPAGDVTVTPAAGADPAVGVSEPLTFTPANWDVAQTVIVTAGEDDDAEDEQTRVTHRVSGYGDVTRTDAVTVTVTDDDTPGVLVTPTALTIDEGGSATYAVALATRPAGDVTVTPIAGAAPAVSVSEPLTFTPATWDVAQDVTVTAGEDDDADDVRTSITHRVSGYGDVTTADAVTVSVTDNDRRAEPLILADLARALADQRLGAVARRIALARSQAEGGARDSGTRAPLAKALYDGLRALDAGQGNPANLLNGARFVLPLAAGEETDEGDAGWLSSLTLWGEGDYRNLSPGHEALRWDGDLLSAHLGADVRLRDTWLAGVAASWSWGKPDYRDARVPGEYELDLVSLHPYLSWETERLNLWATLGYGQGELKLRAPTSGRRASSDVNTRTVGGGLTGLVWSRGAASLRLKGEALQTWLEVEGSDAGGVAPLTVASSRIRLVAETRYQRVLANGSRLAPYLDAGLRHDGGDGDTGAGVEVGGGVSYTDPDRGLSVAGKARTLLDQGSPDEWGIQGRIEFTPRGGRGLSLRLLPGYGNSEAGMQTTWVPGLREAAPRPADRRADSMRLETYLGYGLPLRGVGKRLLTPYAELTLGSIDSYRLGLRLAHDKLFDMTLYGAREAPGATGGNAIRLEARLQLW